MRALAFLACVLLLLPVVSAETSSAVAIVRFEVLNAPPALLSLAISPDDAAPYHTLSCTGEIRDNEPDGLSLRVSWLRGSELLSIEQAFVPADYGLVAGDEVTCEAFAVDAHGAASSARSASIVLREGRQPAALLHNTLTFLGVSGRGAVAAADAGMIRVTGFVAGGAAGAEGIMLYGLLAALVLVNLALLGRRLARPAR